MSETDPKIAVLLPVYRNDRAKYLEQAIDSILNQTYTNYIILIGIDGEIPESLRNIVQRYKQYDSIKVIQFEQNRGLAMVLNDLISIARNENVVYLARMDADDISISDRFKKQVEFLENHPEVDVVGGAICEIDEAGNSRNKIIQYPKGNKECKSFFAYRNPHAHPAVMFRWHFFEKIGHQYRPEYRQNQDTMLWFDGFSNGTNNANISDVVLKFRMTESLFKKRRNGFRFAKKQFLDRLTINRTLGYGIKANIFGFAMFCLLISPTSIRKLAYRIFR